VKSSQAKDLGARQGTTPRAHQAKQGPEVFFGEGGGEPSQGLGTFDVRATGVRADQQVLTTTSVGATRFDLQGRSKCIWALPAVLPGVSSGSGPCAPSGGKRGPPQPGQGAKRSPDPPRGEDASSKEDPQANPPCFGAAACVAETANLPRRSLFSPVARCRRRRGWWTSSYSDPRPHTHFGSATLRRRSWPRAHSRPGTHHRPPADNRVRLRQTPAHRPERASDTENTPRSAPSRSRR
jgi:hypothetical protein